MKLFKSYTYTWWQIGIFKIALLAIGAIVGAYWSGFFLANLFIFILVAVIASLYLVWISFK
ncbi:MAG: hypothetical protein PHN37_02565 [Candidatus Pacebacteria bacterium]|nr:hypothetical protein [Candidatus Paceibacterota bacterium]